MKIHEDIIHMPSSIIPAAIMAAAKAASFSPPNFFVDATQFEFFCRKNLDYDDESCTIKSAHSRP